MTPSYSNKHASSDILAAPPENGRERDLWLQHAAGFLMFRDVGDYARNRIDATLDEGAKKAAGKAIDDALYGLMMLIDGVSGGLENDSHRVDLQVSVRLSQRKNNEEAQRLNLSEGDGACMGYHLWARRNFGDAPVVERF